MTNRDTTVGDIVFAICAYLILVGWILLLTSCGPLDLPEPDLVQVDAPAVVLVPPIEVVEPADDPYYPPPKTGASGGELPPLPGDCVWDGFSVRPEPEPPCEVCRP